MLLPQETIKQLVGVLSQQLGHETTNAPAVPTTAELTSLITSQLLRAPLYIYIGLVALSYVFNSTPLLRWGRTFCAAPLKAKLAHIHNWKHSTIKVKGDFILFFESFIVLGLHEEYQESNFATNRPASGNDEEAP